MTLNRRSLRATAATLVLLAVTALVTPAVASPVPETAAVAAAAPSRAAATRVARHPAAGADYHALWGDRTDADRRAMFDRLDAIGVRWVRIGFPWALVQPYKPTATNPGWKKWGLDRVDTVVRMAAARGIHVSFTFVGTPGWANGGRGPKYLPNDPADYARAIQYLAHRYRGKVTSWEIWNEVSGGYYLKGATMKQYVDLLCAAYPAVHRGSPRAQVVSAGTGGVDYRWIHDFYAAGSKRCFDVLAVHPYNRDKAPLWTSGHQGPLWLRNMSRVRQIMRNNHDLAKRVWFTEFGWNTGPTSSEGITPAEQAAFLVQMFRVTDRRLPYVTHMCWYMAKDEEPSATSHSLYGLYTYDMHAKPAVAAMRKYLAGLR